jgi:hypothetical protein
MFRRRRLMNNPQLDSLVEANQLWASGHPAQAAASFAQIASVMQESQHPRRAANLHAQAARAFADAREPVRALEQARAALTLFLQLQMPARAVQFFTNITHLMANQGLQSAAQALQTEFGARIAGLPAPQPASAPELRGRLPAACPKCGGPVRSDEVSWIDQTSAECIYCGAILQTE